MQSAFVLPAAPGRCATPRVHPDDLPRPHVAHDLGSDQVERAGLGGDDPVLADPAHGERAETERVAKRDQCVVDESRHRVGALEPPIAFATASGNGRRIACDERRDHLGVRARAEPHAVLDQLRAQLLDVHEVPVVAEGDRARAPVMDQGLRVRPAVRPRRRVARVPDRDLARQRLELLLVEDLGDEAHVANDGEPAAVGDRDPRGLLAAVLEREQAEVGEARDVPLIRADAEDATHQRFVPRRRVAGAPAPLPAGYRPRRPRCRAQARRARPRAAGHPRAHPGHTPALPGRRPRRTARAGHRRASSPAPHPEKSAASARQTASPPSEASWTSEQSGAARQRKETRRASASRSSGPGVPPTSP